MSVAAAWQPGQLLILESKRFDIRSMTAEDVSDEYISWWNDAKIMGSLNQPARNWKKAHAVKHVGRFNNISSFHLGIYRKEINEAVGFFAIFHDKNLAIALLNIVVGNKKYWGSRAPEEVAGVVFPFLFEQLKVVKIKTEILGHNRSSLAAARRIGLVEEAVLRQEKPAFQGGRLDQHIFGLLAEEWRARADR